MSETIGQVIDATENVVVPDRYEDRNLSYPERRAIREFRLKPTANEASRKLREAEDALDFARDTLGTVATNLLLGEATEDDVLAVEREIADAERAIRRWKAAGCTLDDLTGVIRDSQGTILR